MTNFHKTKPDYVDIPDNFTPLPKYGHLSEKTPEWTAAEPAVGAALSKLTSLPDFPAIREAAGNADAVMPPGGPDRYSAVVTELLRFPARDGELIELKVYKAPNVVRDATLMYRMHGGGWTVGSHEIDGAENVYAASLGNIVVVSVNYRKSPEHPFPQPFHDCYDGLVWCKNNAETLGINPESIILGGGSAGGNLAAALALEARDTGITGIVAQVLHFPPLCHPKFFPREKYEFGSFVHNRDSPVLTLLHMERAYDAYMPVPEPDQRNSPLLAESLSGLPPTLLQIAGGDVLRDDGFAYGEALGEAGVKVDVYCYAGLPHWFFALLPTAPETAVYYQRFTDFLTKHAKKVGSASEL